MFIIYKMDKEIKPLSDYLIPKWGKDKVIRAERVKEFIKNLKESRKLEFKDGTVYFISEEDLNKLAGEKLI